MTVRLLPALLLALLILACGEPARGAHAVDGGWGVRARGKLRKAAA